MNLYNAILQRKTDRNGSGFMVNQWAGEGDNFSIECDTIGKRNFNRLSYGKGGSPCWVTIEMEEIKNSRRKEISIKIDKAQLLQLIENLKVVANSITE